MLNDANRIRERTDAKGAVVSTIFLGFEHEGNFFETIVLGGRMDGNVSYAPTLDDALALHREMVTLVKRSIA